MFITEQFPPHGESFPAQSFRFGEFANVTEQISQDVQRISYVLMFLAQESALNGERFAEQCFRFSRLAQIAEGRAEQGH